MMMMSESMTSTRGLRRRVGLRFQALKGTSDVSQIIKRLRVSCWSSSSSKVEDFVVKIDANCSAPVSGVIG
jgi:hypothetical protein